MLKKRLTIDIPQFVSSLIRSMRTRSNLIYLRLILFVDGLFRYVLVGCDVPASFSLAPPETKRHKEQDRGDDTNHRTGYPGIAFVV